MMTGPEVAGQSLTQFIADARKTWSVILEPARLFALAALATALAASASAHATDLIANAAFVAFPNFNRVINGDEHSGSSALHLGNLDNGPLAALSQTFADVAGLTYSASLYVDDLGAHGDANAFFKVAIDGTAKVVLDDTVASYMLETFSFVGTGSDTLSLAAQTNPNEWAVDDVSVTTVAAAPRIPEPATWAVMLVGFDGLGAAMRARRSGTLHAFQRTQRNTSL